MLTFEFARYEAFEQQQHATRRVAGFAQDVTVLDGLPEVVQSEVAEDVTDDEIALGQRQLDARLIGQEFGDSIGIERRQLIVVADQEPPHRKQLGSKKFGAGRFSRFLDDRPVELRAVLDEAFEIAGIRRGE